MQKQIFAVYDVVACQIFGPLFLLPNAAVAARTFSDAILDAGSSMASHPEDFVLLHLGAVDIESGKLIPGFGAEAPVGYPAAQVVSGDMVVTLQKRKQDAGSSPQLVVNDGS